MEASLECASVQEPGRQIPNLGIMKFAVSLRYNRRLRTIDIGELPDPEEWMRRLSLLRNVCRGYMVHLPEHHVPQHCK